jgi:uncharacterized phage-associated protein
MATVARTEEGGAVNLRKLEEAVHFICSTCTAADRLGATKLNKILYYADMISFAESGRSITGATYVKRQRGPVPKEILRALNNLKNNKRIETREVSVFDFVRREFEAIGDTDLTVFASSEIEILSRMIRVVCNHSAEEISDISHTIVWQSADMGEVLPYETFLVSYLGDINDDELQQAVGIIKGMEQNYVRESQR